mgnify:CR=1 FL=1
MRSMAAVAAALALAGCVTQGAQQQADVVVPATLTPGQIAAMHAAVRRVLKDPESGRFGEHRAGRGGDGILVVCGLVNAKNSYGGYVGMKPFTGGFSGNEFKLAALASDEYEVPLAHQMCARRGLALGES